MREDASFSTNDLKQNSKSYKIVQTKGTSLEMQIKSQHLHNMLDIRWFCQFPKSDGATELNNSFNKS